MSRFAFTRFEMRRVCFFVIFSGISIVGPALWACGCSTHHRDCVEVGDPDSRKICEAFLSAGTPADCVPSENSKPVEDTCGVFVSSSKGADGAAGTKSAPLKTLAEAITKANGLPVYACAEAFAGSVTLASGSAIFGGLDCTKDWAYVGATTKSTLTGDADKPALVLASTANGAKVEDFTITAANAMTAGGSSIAVVVDGATAELSRCDLIAGDAIAGAAGAAYPSAAQAGAMGLPGSDACKANSILGGDSVVSMCGMPDSISGLGGNGTVNSGGDGSNGSPGAAMNRGIGEVGAVCTAGTVGDAGPAGMPGAGATGAGTIDKTGYTGAAGMPGTGGGPGQGGGGGGGAKGGTGMNQCMAGMAGGASGGSGGSGGCGGLGGKSGSAGGSSIGLISLKANVSFTDVKVSTGNGGPGGDGGPGQDGGLGGAPGAGGTAPSGLKPACNGGNGAMGGKGGKGGGGLGGHAIGIAHTGTAPPMKGVTFDKKGTAGKGGAGADAMHDGAAGVQADMQSF
jgi:hypothetical protein